MQTYKRRSWRTAWWSARRSLVACARVRQRRRACVCWQSSAAALVPRAAIRRFQVGAVTSGTSVFDHRLCSGNGSYGNLDLCLRTCVYHVSLPRPALVRSVGAHGSTERVHRMRSSQVEVVACEMGRRTEVAADDRPVSTGSPHCGIEWTSGPARCACITQAHSSCVVRKTHSQYAAYNSLGPAMNRRPLSPSVQRHRCHGFCVAGRRLYGASGLLVNWPYRCDDPVTSPGVGESGPAPRGPRHRTQPCQGQWPFSIGLKLPSRSCWGPVGSGPGSLSERRRAGHSAYWR